MMKWWIILEVIIALGLSGYSIATQSIRLDEAQSIWMSSKSVAEFLKLTAADVNAPLYGLILHYWIQLVGNRVALVRVISLIFWLILLPVLYKTIKESSNEKIASYTLMFFIFSPFLIWYSGEARTYTLFLLAVVTNVLFFLRMMRSKLMAWKWEFVVTLAFGWYSHYFFGLLVAVESIYALVKSKRIGWTGTLKVWGMELLGVLALGPWLYRVYSLGLAAETQPLLSKPTTFNVLQLYANFLLGFQSSVIQAFFISFWPILGLILVIAFTGGTVSRPKSASFWLLLTFVPPLLAFLISLIRPIFLPRYLILTTPGLFFWMAWFLVNQRKNQRIILISLLLVTMISLSIVQSVSASTTVREDYQETARYLQGEVQPQDIVAISAPFTIYPIEYNYFGNARLATIPDWDRFTGKMPPFSETNMVEQIGKYKQTYYRLFLVLSYDQGYENDIRSYMDNNFQLLEEKTFPANIKVRVYKLRYD